MAEQEIKKIAIIFSGGMVRGAAQMTFAKEIIKATGIERICLVTGSSIGAMNAYAIGVNNIDRLLDIYNDIDCDNVRHFMRKIRNDLFNDAFNKIEREEIIVPTYVTATKLWGFDCHYFCLNKMPREDIKAAINASMGFPLINGSQKFAHHRFVDGGATDNVPVYPCMYYDPDMIIILHCYSRYYPPTYLFEKLNNPIIIGHHSCKFCCR